MGSTMGTAEPPSVPCSNGRSSAGTSSDADPGEAVCAASHRPQRGDFFECDAGDPLDFPVVDFRLVDFRVVDLPVVDFPVADFPVVDFAEVEDSAKSVESV